MIHLCQCALPCEATIPDGELMCAFHASLAPDGMMAKWRAMRLKHDERLRSSKRPPSTVRIRRLGHRIASEVAWSLGRASLAEAHERVERLIGREAARNKRDKRTPLLDATVGRAAE